eukprot:475101-Hanusia_phi.AAC.1
MIGLEASSSCRGGCHKHFSISPAFQAPPCLTIRCSVRPSDECHKAEILLGKLQGMRLPRIYDQHTAGDWIACDTCLICVLVTSRTLGKTRAIIQQNFKRINKVMFPQRLDAPI